MDFAALPPEINSARMYAGPGISSFLFAASAWNSLAIELQSASTSYRMITDELTQEWLGPSSLHMANAIQQHILWLSYTSSLAEQTAQAIRSAATAYENALQTIVPPAVVNANRLQRVQLMMSNRFGQNTAALALNEIHYEQMWVQDAAVMYSYAEKTAQATRLAPFTNPSNSVHDNTNDPGVISGQQIGNLSVQGPINGLLDQINKLLGSMNGPNYTRIASLLTSNPELTSSLIGLGSDLFGTFVLDTLGTFGFDVIGTFGIDMIGVGEIGTEMASEALVMGSITPLNTSFGQAPQINGLSVPQTWIRNTSLVKNPMSLVSQVLSLPSTSNALPATTNFAADNGMSMTEIATAGLVGGSTATLTCTGQTVTKQKKVSHSPQIAATSHSEDSSSHSGLKVRPLVGPITRISGELRALAELRDNGILTEKEFQQEKQRLLQR